jgi:hypothetical protein
MPFSPNIFNLPKVESTDAKPMIWKADYVFHFCMNNHLPQSWNYQKKHWEYEELRKNV